MSIEIVGSNMSGVGKKKVWILQPGIAPYRIPLFAKLANRADIDLTVVLVCDHVYQQPWRISLNDLPFPTRLLQGLSIRIDNDRRVEFPWRLMVALIVDRPDVVICSGFTLPTLLCDIASRITKTKYLIWNEGTVYSETHAGSFKRWIRRQLASRAAGFIVAGSLSEQYIRSILSRRDKPFYLAYNCIESERFSQDTLSDEANQRTAFGHTYSPRNLLYVGRLTERKGIIELLTAYTTLISDPSYSDVGLIMLGQGEMADEVRGFIASNKLERVYLKGFVEQTEIHKYYNRADAFVLLSRFDPNPLVIFEALAAGIPIVCSNRAGNAADFIKDGENGFVVDPFARQNVVEALKGVLSFIERQKAKQTSHQLVARANYDAAAIAFSAAINDCGALARPV